MPPAKHKMKEPWAKAFSPSWQMHSKTNVFFCNPLLNLPLPFSTIIFTPQAIQDMNSLKRFVRQAEMSHYALFRCYQFLLACGNGDVLLQNARAEHSDHPEAGSIITVLEDFLKEQALTQT